MVTDSDRPESAARTAGQFATTHWSLVQAAGDSASPNSRDALDLLCRTYWYPLYAFVRREGKTPEDARDLTQAFFERFLEKHYLKDVLVEKGRFRTFLLTTFKRFLCDQFDRSTAAKRGGGISFVPLDAIEAETQFAEASVASQSPEATFDRAWAEAVVQSGVERLRAEFEGAGQGLLFRELKGYLSCPADRASYTDVAQRLGMTTDAVAMAVMRLRRRYRAMVRAEVAKTVATPAEIDEEMRYLVELMAT
jgi:DNA-directed RNA polymerase specialized sigma24 family protein